MRVPRQNYICPKFAAFLCHKAAITSATVVDFGDVTASLRSRKTQTLCGLRT